MTEWRTIPSFPNYEVSEWGEVRRCKSAEGKGGGTSKVGKWLRTISFGDGYRGYILYVDGRQRNRRAHLLVLEAFYGPKPFPAAEGRHLDGTRTNNHYTNLRWGTRSENAIDRWQHSMASDRATLGHMG